MVPAVLLTAGSACAAEDVVRVGAGSYTTVPPKGMKEPPAAIFQTESVKGKMPTNDWWSSLAWLKFSERHYPHPLAVEAEKRGLRVFYPGNNITGTKDAIFGFMPAKTGDDLTLGHSAQADFPDALVDGFSDWFVTVRFASGPSVMRVSYGHGSPFVYALFEGGSAAVSFAQPPKVWSGDEQSAVLGVSIRDKPYGLFGPSGSKWSGLGSKMLTNSAAARHFSLAILPDNAPETLALFKQYAYAHVTDTRVAWSYDEKTGAVATTHTFTTTAREGDKSGTLFALYPHQWRHTKDALPGKAYPSVRGAMKLREGSSFATEMRFPGVLPALPKAAACDKERLAGYLKAEAGKRDEPLRDTYGEGKWLGKLATLAPLAEQYQLDDDAKALRERLAKRLERWFTAASSEGKPKPQGLFYYHERWGTLIGWPASFGSDNELNDHHFHYGYFIKAAAEVARRDPAWAAPERFGGMVKLLIRDFASPDRADPLFPFLRNFDPYAGHSWASGHARFGDGNNNESSSEAMNAWCALVLWGEATGDTAVRDLGIYLYTTEMAAINEYWFNVQGEHFPKGYPASVVTMVWGGKGANGTWFSAKPEHIHGINWLPLHGGSLYLGRYPEYVEKNYAALVREKGGTNWSDWPDLIWMYRALADPADALAQFEAAEKTAPFEGGNSKANAYHWICALKEFGQVDASVSADYPIYAVFRKGAVKTHCVWNIGRQPRTVRFSDGCELRAEGGAWAVGR